jgi:hypothetical protein
MTARALQVTARRLQLLRAEADTLQHDIHALVAAVAPWLLELPRGGTDHCRPGPGQLVTCRTVALRGRLRGPGRDQPDPGLLGAGDPLPAQPPDANRPFADDAEHTGSGGGQLLDGTGRLRIGANLGNAVRWSLVLMPLWVLPLLGCSARPLVASEHIAATPASARSSTLQR